MGLHSYNEETGDLEYYCTNPECSHHSCADWEAFRTCAHHDQMEYVVVPAAEMQQRLAGVLPPEQLQQLGDTIISQQSAAHRVSGGTSNVHHASHEDIKWTGPNEVQLPMCECGTQMTLKVNFSDAELNAPNIKIVRRNKDNPTIIDGIDQHPMVARHQALAKKLEQLGNVYRPLL